MTLDERKIARMDSLKKYNFSEKRRATQQRYYEKNKELCSARVKESHFKNVDYYSAKSMQWAIENKERYLQNRRNHYSRNSASEIARVRRRQGKIKHGELLMNQAEQAEVQGMYDFCKIFKGYEVDHIIPLNGKTVSGLHILGNLQVLPMALNRSKGNKFETQVNDFQQQEHTNG
jgi:hypothetical protein